MPRARRCDLLNVVTHTALPTCITAYRYSSAPELNDVLHLQHKGILKLENLEVQPCIITADHMDTAGSAGTDLVLTLTAGLHRLKDPIPGKQCYSRHRGLGGPHQSALPVLGQEHDPSGCWA